MSWDPHFYKKSPLFWPLRPAAEPFVAFTSWPLPADLERAFVGEPPVRFEPSAPRTRRGRAAPADARYDARIALHRRVPTRVGVWHDFANALVWATFPRAKAALHTRQHRLIAAQLGPDLRLPMRTKEQDAVAMLDEGGVAVVCARAVADAVRGALAAADNDALLTHIAAAQSAVIVFGHAIYEALATGPTRVLRSAAHLVAVDALGASAAERVAQADAALAWRFLGAERLGRADFASLLVDARWAA